MLESNDSEKESNDSKKGGNIGLPFGLCKKHGITLQEGATPRDAWNALEKIGITPEKVYKGLGVSAPWDDIKTNAPSEYKQWIYEKFQSGGELYKELYKKPNGEIDYDKFWENNKWYYGRSIDKNATHFSNTEKAVFLDNPKTGNTVFDYIQRPQVRAKIHGKFPEHARRFSLNEIWINAGPYGHYFSLEIDGKREFVSVDPKAANGNRFIEISFVPTSYKVKGNGYIYLDEKGKARFAFADGNNYQILREYKKY